MEEQTINFLGCECPQDPKEHDAFYLPSVEKILIFHDGEWVLLDKLYPKDRNVFKKNIFQISKSLLDFRTRSVYNIIVGRGHVIQKKSKER